MLDSYLYFHIYWRDCRLCHTYGGAPPHIWQSTATHMAEHCCTYGGAPLHISLHISRSTATQVRCSAVQIVEMTALLHMYLICLL